jgi:hypothetical protein
MACTSNTFFMYGSSLSQKWYDTLF